MLIQKLEHEIQKISAENLALVNENNSLREKVDEFNKIEMLV